MNHEVTEDGLLTAVEEVHVPTIPSWSHPDPAVRFRILEAVLGISNEPLEVICAETQTSSADSAQLLASLEDFTGTPRWIRAMQAYQERQLRITGVYSSIVKAQEEQARDTYRAALSTPPPRIEWGD